MTTDRDVPSARPALPLSTSPKLAAATTILLVVAAACSPGSRAQTPGPSTGPTPTATPTQAGIRHPTGAKEVLLRMETSGGFAPFESMATSAPTFKLYSFSLRPLLPDETK